MISLAARAESVIIDFSGGQVAPNRWPRLDSGGRPNEKRWTMKKAEIRVGGLYTARISGKFVTVRVDVVRDIECVSGTNYDGSRKYRDTTVFDVTNLTTGRKTTFRSAAKFRGEATGQPVVTNEDGEKRQIIGAADRQGGEQHDSTSTVKFDSLTTIDGGTYLQENKTEDSAGGAGIFQASNLASIIASQYSSVTTGLTHQQQDILSTAKQIENLANGGPSAQRVMVIGAGAGTGKTFTLKQLEHVLQGNGQYTAFNSSLVAESKAKFTRASCNTTHSLAFRAVGCRYKHRLGGARVKSWEVANRLGIKDFVVELPEGLAPYDDGKPQTRTLKAAFLAGQVTLAIRKFCQSADREVVAKHFQRFDGIDEPGKYVNSNRVKEYLLGFAQSMWADLTNTNGTLPFSHDVYVKIWELDQPVIASDYILLDEAQDTAPVMLSILRQQEHALLILVGDDNQSIYQWRGAVNAMASFPGAPRKLLSQSFRFGQVVADVANSILKTLEEPTDLVMSGLPTIPTRVCRVEKPRCYLYRTNAGAIGKMMAEIDAGRRAHIIGKTDDIVSFCRAALDLQRGSGTTHPELGCFTTWGEVVEYSQTDEGDDLRLMVKLVKDFTAERIIRTLDNMPPENRADTVISTAHRSKGREWLSVKLGQDFKTVDKLTDEERRLLYVACTRAQEELDLTECPTFCGGYSKTGGGEDGDANQMYVPGLEITYTVPMPTADDLVAYRAAKSAPASPKLAPESPAATNPASPTPNAVEFKGNQRNGNSSGNGGHSFLPDGQNIWTKGKYNDWVVRGKSGQSGTITVTRRNGTTSQETIRRVIWEDVDQGVALYEV